MRRLSLCIERAWFTERGARGNALVIVIALRSHGKERSRGGKLYRGQLYLILNTNTGSGGASSGVGSDPVENVITHAAALPLCIDAKENILTHDSENMDLSGTGGDAQQCYTHLLIHSPPVFPRTRLPRSPHEHLHLHDYGAVRSSSSVRHRSRLWSGR